MSLNPLISQMIEMIRPRDREQLASSHTLLRRVFGSQPQLWFFFGHNMALLLFHVFSFCLLKINRNEKENQNAHWRHLAKPHIHASIFLARVNPAMALACDHDHFQVRSSPCPPFTSQALLMFSVYFFTESQDLECIFRFLASKMWIFTLCSN